ncbi:MULTISPECIES: ferredoxin reductase [unclassified Rhodococcus (in: high G+C Gram-positive bacteria)]|uniref:ferredoxin reductase n=1 Tax=unclassified Rhodococcus (in: high G+C Gram-positive bacteria) TaxID=192944 RepID=UPI001C9AF710|nr:MULTISPECIES: ferredoxin reductase [unclassified Rhodococcus (in: high G+C Gram-positive bacteria)]MBY6677578.1 ferredoxin reductase [Rhodococcus sp. BP-332]MDQ1202603.1 ferredoxin-NADP reductase [Rhodococcus sp. SORGH_AS_0303]
MTTGSTAGVGARPWLVSTVLEVRRETPTASTLVLDVDGWPGHLAGQHVDVKLTAEDGYSAQRSYSLASAPDGTSRIEIAVQNVSDGEVSPYLVGAVEVGDRFEIRGPVGRWFVWRPSAPTETPSPPVLLVGGGSGIVPLRAMVRAQAAAGSSGGRVPFRVLYSVREPAEVYFADEWAHPPAGVDVTTLYTRRAPTGSRRPLGRITIEDLDAHGWPAEFEPRCYICGPTSFVDTVADMLVERGHAPANIRTERFGPS